MPLRASCLVVAGFFLAAAEPLAGTGAVIAWMRLAEFGFLGAFCWYGIS